MYQPVKIFIVLILISSSCQTTEKKKAGNFTAADIKLLQEMFDRRKTAMINRDINAVIQQFDTGASFINGGGFYFEGINEIRDFHNSMFLNDSLTYTYQAGQATVRRISESAAILHYPWQQNWTLRKVQSDTFKETGLMTIIAVKNDSGWKWKSIINQRTKEFFENVTRHKSTGIK